MFATLLLKEIREMLLSWRFAMSALIVVILIPLAVYVSLGDYRERLTTYQEAVAIYADESEGSISSSFNAVGYRPPSPLSVFVTGIEPIMPNRTETTSIHDQLVERAIDNGIVSLTNESSLDDPLNALFGKMDFLFIASTVLSMLAFVFTFAGIAGEREQGTLKQIVANPVSRGAVLVAKIAGSFLLFILSYLVACGTGVVILSVSDIFPLAEPDMLASVLAIISVTILFLLCMFILGTLISTCSKNAVTAFITLLFAWVFLALVIPKLSPMIARQVYPVQTRESILRQLAAVRTDILNELHVREREVFEQVLARHGLTEDEFKQASMAQYFSPDSVVLVIENEYEALVAPLHEEYAERLAAERERNWRDYTNECDIQQRIARQLSRLSPVSSLTYVLTAIASTGLDEIDRFTREAERFQDDFIHTMHQYYVVSWIGNNASLMELESPYDLQVPQMDGYRRASLAEAFSETWIDLLLLAFYTVLFFAGAFVTFLRYDVR